MPFTTLVDLELHHFVTFFRKGKLEISGFSARSEFRPDVRINKVSGIIMGTYSLQIVVIHLAIFPHFSIYRISIRHNAKKFSVPVRYDGQGEKADLVVKIIGPDRVHADHLVGKLNIGPRGVEQVSHPAYVWIHIAEIRSSVLV